MHNAERHQAQVKVAVYTAQAPSPEGLHPQLQEFLACTLIALSALVAFWIG
ncbi:MAG: hypothetical protein QNJ46_21935 [Leptolyngbyaceae cyanobacterium MO_188.B28]|nr:hypothetical protein [Leptolyngbyaceae cyanobacterium MO_188.B28]